MLEWKEVVITLVDPITRDELGQVGSKLSSLVEVFRNIGSVAIKGYEKPTASRTSRAFKTVRIHSLPPGGGASETKLDAYIDTWELVRPTLTNIDFGSLTYGQDDPQEITISFLYLYPKYYKYENGEQKQILL